MVHGYAMTVRQKELMRLLRQFRTTAITVHREHIGNASKSDVSPNTPPADEANL